MVRIGVSGVRLRNQKVMKSRTGMIQAYSLKALLKAVISTPRSNMIHGLINPLPTPGNVVGAVHARRGTRAAARGAPGAAW